ncbi:MAG: hypothetical protein OXG10_02715 [Candidatus Dadabacteria bacterium]|nr:hypothetical protein [Candidatus Dadabacteria bacterium]
MAARKSRKNRKGGSRKNRTSGKSGKPASAKPSGSAGGTETDLSPRRSMESVMSMVTRLAFPGGREGAAGGADELSRLGRAQEIIYDAWEVRSRHDRISMAKEALALSGLCADAWVILAEETGDIVEAREFYERAVKAGTDAVELELGPDAFTEHAGRFWGILQTRPYMRALEGLSDCMWEMGEKGESVGIMREMLRLNPNDNQGVRSFLVPRLFAVGDLEGVEDILVKYAEPYFADWSWNTVLFLFRRDGDSADAVSAFNEAFETNSFVPGLLTGTRQMPKSLPEYYSPGSLEEAVVYTFFNRRSWLSTKGALAWVSKRRKK